LDATALVVGSIIGSGIFLKVGNVDRALQAYGFVPIVGVWGLVGLITLCGALAISELAAMYPQAGGPYLYLREAYGRLPAFLWGWTEFWVVRTGSVGALACATAIYLDQVVPLGHLGQEIVAIAIVVGLSLINLVSTRWAANVQAVVTIIKVLFLASLIALPVALRRGEVGHWSPAVAGAMDVSFWKALGIAMIAVLWAYDGWINLGPVAEEIKYPQRNIPRAMALGLITIILVYVGAILSYHLVLTMSEVAGTATVASDMFSRLCGPTGLTIAALGVMCSTFGAVNSYMITGPRIYLAMARDGMLHYSIHAVHDRFRTPMNAILLQATWTTLVIIAFFAWKETPKEAFDGLTDSVILAGLIFYSMTVAAVYVLRLKRPAAERPYRTWGYPFTPLLLLLAYAAAFVSSLAANPQQSAVVIGLITAGLVYYFFMRRSRR
jgi:APA family basic amino acid/polyamine antiporter